ncbi:MAG: putative quinol monooxygenase [Psychroflexus sp.]
MFVRIVKMTFQQDFIKNFERIFEDNKLHIRGFEGCELLELYQDKNQPNIFFTYSYWQDESDLENYRHSDLFKKVWKATKAGFSEKAEAWSLDKKIELH